MHVEALPAAKNFRLSSPHFLLLLFLFYFEIYLSLIVKEIVHSLSFRCLLT
jgi:hypothetical protein